MKHPFAVLLAIVAILAFGCSTHAPIVAYPAYARAPSPPPDSYVPEIVPVYIDKDFKADARADIHAALDEWNFAFNGYVTYLVVSDGFDMDEDVIERVNRTGQGLIIVSIPDAFLDLFVPEGVLAWVDDLGDPVVHVASGRIGTRNLKKIVMHEIGHVLGVPHTTASNTLMSKYYQDQAACIDDYTLRTLAGTKFARSVHWQWQFMNACRPS